MLIVYGTDGYDCLVSTSLHRIAATRSNGDSGYNINPGLIEAILVGTYYIVTCVGVVPSERGREPESERAKEQEGETLCEVGSPQPHYPPETNARRNLDIVPKRCCVWAFSPCLH